MYWICARKPLYMSQKSLQHYTFVPTAVEGHFLPNMQMLYSLSLFSAPLPFFLPHGKNLVIWGQLEGIILLQHKDTQLTSKIKDTTHQTNQVQVKELTHQPLYHLPTRSFIFATMCTTSTTQTAMARRATGDHFMDVSVVFCTISLKTRWVVPFGTHCKTTWY